VRISREESEYEKKKKKKKNIVSDNPLRNNQHTLSLEEEDIVRNLMTRLEQVFHYQS
jgi:hypothetical protein